MRKTLTFPLEVKALKDREFEGYGSTFGNVDLGGDVVMPGAFTKSLAAKMPKMLYQHRPDKIAGVWKEMHEDSKGLHVRGEFINTTLGNDAYIEMKSGALDGLSIGYAVVKDDGKRNPRRLTELDLWEVSVVTFPMNESALVDSIKQFYGQMPQTKRELEEMLFDRGMSHTEAKTFISDLGKIFAKRESDDMDSDGTLDVHLRDAGDVEDTKAVLAALNIRSGKFMKEMLRRN